LLTGDGCGKKKKSISKTKNGVEKVLLLAEEHRGEKSQNGGKYTIKYIVQALNPVIL
jgi:hypothetical protein